MFGKPSAAQDQNAFAVTKAFADKHGVKTLSDLAEACGSGLVLGGPPECPERPFCQPGLEETYGLAFGSFSSLDAGGPLTKTALKQGKVTVGLVFSSDAALASQLSRGSRSSARTGYSSPPRTGAASVFPGGASGQAHAGS